MQRENRPKLLTLNLLENKDDCIQWYVGKQIVII